MRSMVRTTTVALGCALIGVCVLGGWILHAQRTPDATVFIDEMTRTEIEAAVAGGKTTLLLMFGGLHENAYTAETTKFSGPGHDAVVTGKHNFEGNYQVRRIAEELGNALAYYAFPYEPNPGAHMNFAGTVHLRDETLTAVVQDITNSSITSSRFKNVIIMGNHGGGEAALEEAAAELDATWSPRGVRVFYFPVYATARRQAGQYLTELEDPNVPPECRSPGQCQTVTGDYARMLFLDDRYVRADKVPAALAELATPEFGKTILERYVAVAVDRIREAVPNTHDDSSR